MKIDVKDIRQRQARIRKPARTPVARPPYPGDRGGGGVTEQRFWIVAIHGDYIECKTWDGSTLGSDIVLVAKPLDIRRTPYDNQTFADTRYEYDSDDVRWAIEVLEDPEATPRRERQVVVPRDRLVVGKEINGTTPILGGTAVTVDGEDVVWTIVNDPALAWARASDQVGP